MKNSVYRPTYPTSDFSIDAPIGACDISHKIIVSPVFHMSTQISVYKRYFLNNVIFDIMQHDKQKNRQ